VLMGSTSQFERRSQDLGPSRSRWIRPYEGTGDRLGRAGRP
jgi:hypothetical protein